MGFLALLLGVLFFSAATAQAAPRRVGVPKFDGVQEALVRKKVMQILKAHGYDLAKSREMEIGLANTGALLDNEEGFQKVAKELALSAVVTGEVGKKRAKIAVHDGKDGSLLGEASFSGANPRKIMAEVGRDFWRKLGGEIERGRPPSGAKKPQKVAEAPEDNEQAPEAGGEGGEGEAPPPKTKAKEPVAAAEGGGEEGAPPPSKKKKKKKLKMEGEGEPVEEPGAEVIPATFDFQLGPGFVNRNLAYHQDVSQPQGLRPYSLPAGALVSASIVWYPLGAFTDGAAKNLGVEGYIEQAFLVTSTLPPDSTGKVQKFGTSIHQFNGGARYRLPFSAGHYLYFSGTGGEHAFTFKSQNGSNRGGLDIPDTIYRYLRPGIGIHFELPAMLTFTLSAGYRWIFNKGGQFHDYFFPHSTVAGVDGQAVIGYHITPMFEARVGVDWRRYFSSMNCYNPSAPGGNQCIRTVMVNGQPTTLNFTAGGAVDQYLTFTAVLAVTMGGTEIARPEAEEAPPPPKRKRKVDNEEEPSAGPEGGGGENE